MPEAFDFTLPDGINENPLAMIFFMQEKLNDFVFQKQGINDTNGNTLMCTKFRQESIDAELTGKPLSPNSNSCQWFRKYFEALLVEGNEALDEAPWKWWSKSGVDLAKLREEIVDCWHFLISGTIASGMDWESLSRAYSAKYAVNVQRQLGGYVARGDKPAEVSSASPAA